MSDYTIQGADGQQYGPVDAATLGAWAREGRIIQSTQVYDHAAQQWVLAKNLNILAAAWPPSALPLPEAVPPPSAETGKCSQCGKDFAQTEMIHYGNEWVCAACKPLFVQKLKEGVDLSAAMDYAGFWIRLVAKMIDGLIIGVPAFLFIFAIGFAFWGSFNNLPRHLDLLINLFQLGYIVVYAIYNTWFVGRYGATPGKMACKLKVVTAEGGPVSYARACGRHFAEMLSGLICNVGYIMAAFDLQKRALHDHICTTRVIKK